MRAKFCGLLGRAHSTRSVARVETAQGRLLIQMLEVFVSGGKVDFSDRKIRGDGALRLPDLKGNLETRLLLSRRLEEKNASIRLFRPSLGRIRLDVDCHPSSHSPRDPASGERQMQSARCRCYGGCPSGAELVGCGCEANTQQLGAPDGQP